MPRQVTVRARYAATPDALFERARSFSDMMQSMRGLASYAGLPAEPMEPGRTYVTDIRVLGLVRYRDFQIRIDTICPKSRWLETSEHNAKVRTWQHRVDIRPDDEGGAIWTDCVTIDAGLRTAMAAQFARVMYRYRHRARRALSVSAEILWAAPRPAAPLPDLHLSR